MRKANAITGGAEVIIATPWLEFCSREAEGMVCCLGMGSLKWATVAKKQTFLVSNLLDPENQSHAERHCWRQFSRDLKAKRSSWVLNGGGSSNIFLSKPQIGRDQICPNALIPMGMASCVSDKGRSPGLMSCLEPFLRFIRPLQKATLL